MFRSPFVAIFKEVIFRSVYYVGSQALVAIEYEAGWAPEWVWTRLEKEKNLLLPKIGPLYNGF